MKKNRTALAVTLGLALVWPCLAPATETPAGAAAANAKAEVFAPGIISGPANDADPAFTPQGDTVFFARNSAILVSHRVGDAWSVPQLAAFSGEWADQQPTMAPDGSFLVFVSNRPLQPGSAKRPAGNLWRVNRTATGWSEAAPLPATVNRSNSIWAPSVAGDGSLYFIERENTNAPFRIWRSQLLNGQYQAAQPVSFGDPTSQDVDPAVAPDESFIVFGSMHLGPGQHERLYIAFKEQDHWGKPIDLGPAVNGDGSTDTNEARLGPDHKTLYFTSERTLPVHYPRTREQANSDLARMQAWDNGNQNIWVISLSAWLQGQQVK
jgi:Tol biopolymer transport system component